MQNAPREIYTRTVLPRLISLLLLNVLALSGDESLMIDLLLQLFKLLLNPLESNKRINSKLCFKIILEHNFLKTVICKYNFFKIPV